MPSEKRHGVQCEPHNLSVTLTSTPLPGGCKARTSYNEIELFFVAHFEWIASGGKKKINVVILANYPAEQRPESCPLDELFCASVILGKCSDPGMRAWECVLILKSSLGGEGEVVTVMG